MSPFSPCNRVSTTSTERWHRPAGAPDPILLCIKSLQLCPWTSVPLAFPASSFTSSGWPKRLSSFFKCSAGKIIQNNSMCSSQTRKRDREIGTTENHNMVRVPPEQSASCNNNLDGEREMAEFTFNLAYIWHRHFTQFFKLRKNYGKKKNKRKHSHLC